MDARGGTAADVKTRIIEARAAFHILCVKRVEVQGNRQNTENPSVQHKCKSVFIQFV